MQMHDTIGFENWIGRTETLLKDIVTPRLVSSFAATFGDAMSSVSEVPVGLHWCLAPPTAHPEELGPDGHPAKGGFLPPVPLPRRMWASGEIEFLAPLQVGDVVQKSSRIKSIDWKTGKTGQMCFVTASHDYATERGTAIREDQNIVYRAAPTGLAPQASISPSAEVFDHQAEVDIDPTRLFRYSALTFNAHRIHYDLAYAKDVEFYPDLVIHGPLKASFLLNFAATVRGQVPKRFTYRGVAPATGAQVLKLGARETSTDELAVAVIDAMGVKAMSGVASW